MEKILMNGDNPVLLFNLEDMYMQVINNNFLPLSLQGYIKTTDAHNIKKTIKDIEFLKDFLISRELTLSRSNAKAILISSAMPQSEKTADRLKIVYACRALTMEDNFWLKDAYEKIQFADVNLRTNKLSDVSYDIAILGKQISATANTLTADLMTSGLFPKYWYRKNGKLYLCKTDKTSENTNTNAELQVSNILEKLGVNAIKYKKMVKDNMVFAVSECFADDSQSLINGYNMQDWCIHHNTTLEHYLNQNYRTDFANMCVIDYVLGNTDRHLGNILLTVDNSTNTIKSFGPLHDHNLTLIIDKTGNNKGNVNLNGIIYAATNKPMLETVNQYAQYSDINFDHVTLPRECQNRWLYVKELQQDLQESYDYMFDDEGDTSVEKAIAEKIEKENQPKIQYKNSVRQNSQEDILR